MTLSIRTILRSFSVLALTAAFMPGCDGDEHEALGLSSEEIDAMSEDELDELAAMEDELDHPVEPVVSVEGFDTLWHPMHTHAGASTEGFDTLWHPMHTHAPAADDISDALRPTHGIETNDKIGLPDPGCQPDTDQPVLTAKR